MASAGGDVIGVDWKTPLDDAWARVGGPASRAVQGNLDPAVLLSHRGRRSSDETRQVLAAAAGRDGHIFNLGHGVLPGTSPDTLRRLVDLVHDDTERRRRMSARDARRGARHGVRHRERPAGHRALLHGHPRGPGAQSRAPAGADASATRRSATCSLCSTRRAHRPRASVARLNADGDGSERFRAYLGHEALAARSSPRASRRCAPTASSAAWAS